MPRSESDAPSGINLGLIRQSVISWVYGLLQSSRVRISALGSGDLVFNLLDSPRNLELYETVRPVIEWMANSPFIAGVLTVFASAAIDFGFLAQVSQLLLYLYVIYVFTPSLYPAGFGEWRRNQGARSVTVGVVAAMSFVPTSSIGLMLVIVAGGLFGIYLTWDDDRLFVPPSAGSGSKTGAVYSVLETLGMEPNQDTSALSS